MNSFEELGVREDLLRAIADMGFEIPMPIQQLVIPHLLNNDNDVVALAQTGTGKTAAFGLPVIQRTNIDNHAPQALIIAPTRELCLQISGDLADFSKYIHGLKVLPVYGGSSIEGQISALKKGVQIIVATPGRLIDLIKRKVVKLKDVHTVILDEADEMLNMGFLESIDEILASVPDDRKMLMFSATMPNEIAKIAKKYMHSPEEFVVGSRNEGAENVKHTYYLVAARDKYNVLKRIVDYLPNIYGIIFCRTRRDTQEISEKLMQEGYNADALHGDLSQSQRDAVMKKFRDRNLQLLVATDVAARGLDVDDLTHIINYGLPDDIATYTHRSGRTGRAGKNGVSIAIVHSKEKGKLRDIEKRIGKTFERKEAPTPRDIVERQLYNLADRIENVEVDESEIADYMPGISKKLGWLNEADLLKRVFSLEFNRLIAYYKDAPKLDLPESRKERKKKKEREIPSAEDKDRRVGEKGYERVYINLGKADGFFAPNLIEMINRNVKGQRIDVGRIDLMPSYSLFDVRNGQSKKVIGALKHAEFYGKRVYCEIAQSDKDYKSESRGKNKKEDKSVTLSEGKHGNYDIFINSDKKKKKKRR
ncbi:MAG: DEAD/DEAH box helicase [Muribaculaceae bacterium]|nr:DEAD/DEAH box helicase [Muribaculaceae bacterium]